MLTTVVVSARFDFDAGATNCSDCLRGAVACNNSDAFRTKQINCWHTSPEAFSILEAGSGSTGSLLNALASSDAMMGACKWIRAVSFLSENAAHPYAKIVVELAPAV